VNISRAFWGLAIWLTLLLWPGLCPAGVWRDPKIEELVVAGTDRLLNLDYTEAEKVFSRLGDLDATGLLAQLYGAFVKLARVEDREATPEELDARRSRGRPRSSSGEPPRTPISCSFSEWPGAQR
jgi:hypothetical protein